ncbi:MAG: tetratricopeptide repeat protein [Flavobacterium sp.]|nr:tetratricopeptide repeat protein [Flavobacterium sp.]
MRNFFTIIICLNLSFAFACLNGETKILKNGSIIYEDYEGVIPHGHQFYQKNFPNLIRELDSLYIATNDVAYLSDKGYILTITKKYQEAIKIYLQIEKIAPNRYSTASNLGTIYELIGQNEEAFKWIEKSIKINPDSHEGSEWLHLNILKAKIEGKPIQGDLLIGLSFGKALSPTTIKTWEDLEKMQKAIFFQLNERISFIKPKDEIIAELLFELANIQMVLKDFYSAIELYKKALSYGLQNELANYRIDLAIERSGESYRARIQNLNNVNDYHKNLFVGTLIISLLIIIVLSLIVFKLRKR